MRKTIFIYPPYTGTESKPGNLYLKLLENSFKGNEFYDLIEVKKYKIPFLNLLFNWNSDIFIFGWVEGLANSWFGRIKFLLIALVIMVARLSRRDVIWILHNRHPHNGKTRAASMAMRYLARMSTITITHSQAGVPYFHDELNKKKGKCYYIPHPVYDDEMVPLKEIEWDYIIWGEITKRKGILEFVKYANSNLFFKTKKILICGRCSDPDYSDRLLKECGDNITFINDFIRDASLKDYISRSRYILFPYQSSSVLSSGALIYSLNFGKPIIAPNVGAFADLDHIVTCYNSFKELENIKIEFNIQKEMGYIENNKWQYFPGRLFSLLENR